MLKLDESHSSIFKNFKLVISSAFGEGFAPIHPLNICACNECEPPKSFTKKLSHTKVIVAKMSWIDCATNGFSASYLRVRKSPENRTDKTRADTPAERRRRDKNNEKPPRLGGFHGRPTPQRVLINRLGRLYTRLNLTFPVMSVIPSPKASKVARLVYIYAGHELEALRLYFCVLDTKQKTGSPLCIRVPVSETRWNAQQTLTKTNQYLVR